MQGPWSPWTVVHVYLGQWPIACSLELSVTQNCKGGNRGLPPTLLGWEFYGPWFRMITQQNINGKIKMTLYSSEHMKQEAQRGGKSLVRFYSSLVTELGLEPMGLTMTSAPPLMSCQWERLCSGYLQPRVSWVPLNWNSQTSLGSFFYFMCHMQLRLCF